MFPLYRLVEFFIAWKNIRLFATPPLVSSRNDVQETSAVILNWSCNWWVETNFQPIRSTTQIWVSFLRRHFVGKSVVGSRNVACFRRLFFFSKASSTILRKSTIFIALFTNAGSHGCSFLKIICFINSVINLPARPVSQTNKLEVYQLLKIVEGLKSFVLFTSFVYLTLTMWIYKHYMNFAAREILKFPSIGQNIQLVWWTFGGNWWIHSLIEAEICQILRILRINPSLRFRKGWLFWVMKI